MYQSLSKAPRDRTRFVGFIRCPFTKGLVPVAVHWETGLREPKFIFNGWSQQSLEPFWAPYPTKDEMKTITEENQNEHL